MTIQNFNYTINKIQIRVKVYKPDGEHIHLIKGREAQSLLALIVHEREGITSLDMGGWAYRLASYIHDLRHEFHLDIKTVDEPHDGGIHARYFLLDAVEVLEVEYPALCKNSVEIAVTSLN